jgi:hypothetical protein
MRCTVCGEEGKFGIACTTGTRVYRKRACTMCCLASTRQHRALKKLHQTPTEECECCGKRGKLVIDHCHITGTYRGWLCQGCNVAIGRLGDTAQGVQRALDYLTRVQTAQEFVGTP